MKREEKDGLAGIRTETVQMRSRLEQNLILVKIHSTLFPFSLRMGPSEWQRGKKPLQPSEIYYFKLNEVFNRSDMELPCLN